jgi:hypothetical protein
VKGKLILKRKRAYLGECERQKDAKVARSDEKDKHTGFCYR